SLRPRSRACAARLLSCLFRLLRVPSCPSWILKPFICVHLRASAVSNSGFSLRAFSAFSASSAVRASPAGRREANGYENQVVRGGGRHASLGDALLSGTDAGE